MLSTRNHVAGIVHIHETGHNHRFPFCLGHVWREFLRNVPVKVMSICIQIEHTFINARCLGIKHNLSTILVFLEISEYVIYPLKMSPVR